MKPKTLHKRACGLLGIDPEKVRLVGPSEWKRTVGGGVSGYLGLSSRKHRMIYVRRTEGLDTYVHELLHQLFPSRQHSWLYAACWKIAKTPVSRRAWLYGYGHAYLATATDATESREKLLKLARASAKRRGLA